MLEDFKIKVFMAVSEELSFTKAARSLGISQPAVSQAIAELEKSLGTSLFRRGRGAVSLTSAGISFKEYASRILYWCSAAEALFSPVRGNESGTATVRISADGLSAGYVLPPVLSALRSVYPGLTFQLIPDGDASGHDLHVWCSPHMDSLSIEEGAGLAGTLGAAAVTSEASFSGITDFASLPVEVRFAVWSPYSRILSPDLAARTVLESYSPSSILGSVALSPETIGLVPKVAVSGNRLQILPVDLGSLRFDLNAVPEGSFGRSSVFLSLRNLMGDMFDPPM